MPSNNLRYLMPLKGNVASPWNPGVENPTLWYRMDSVSGSGSSLTFIDKGPNGFDATVVASSGPTIVPSVINGQPVARFVAASSQSMTMAGTTPLVTVNASNTIVLVSKGAAPLTSGNFSVPLSLATNNVTPLFTTIAFANNASYGNLFQGGGTISADVSVGLTTFDYSTNFFGFVSSYDGGGSFSTASNYSWLINNTSNNPTNFAAGAVGTTTASNNVGSFGPSGLYFDGDIAEIIVFSSALSGPTLAKLHTYLNNRYGIGVG